MTQQVALSETLDLGRMGQIVLITGDLDATVNTYESTYGIGPFRHMELKPDKCFIQGRDPQLRLKVAVTQLQGGMWLEVIEILEGEPYHKDFLEKNGDGVECLGFFPRDYDSVLEKVDSLGIGVLMKVEAHAKGLGLVRATFLDTKKQSGVVMKIMDIGGDRTSG